jgi:ABC-type molybdenum transport system ATPase subunit/photorepair protein PhrA
VSLLEVERASSFYGDFQALYDISLAVEEGERFAVIGSNGAGKSTLLRMIAGLLPARGGNIRFDGRPIDALRVHERVGLGISLVPDGASHLSQPEVRRTSWWAAIGEVVAAAGMSGACTTSSRSCASGRGAVRRCSPVASSRRWPSGALS